MGATAGELIADDAPGQLDLPGMPRRLFACTPSRLATFADCPRRYRMTYLDRPQPGRGAPWAHNSMGAAVHLVLKRWWDLPRTGRTGQGAARLLDEAWAADGFRDEAQSRDWRSRARGWLTAYLARLDPAREPAAVECQVATRTDTLAISGRVDRIDRGDGELVIVDYKTGRWVPDADDARDSPALALYVLGTRRTFRAPCRRVELHHLPTGTTAVFEHTEESLAGHVGRAEDAAEQILRAAGSAVAGAPVDVAYPPRPAGRCRGCDFRRHCPEGRQVGPAHEPWAALTP